ncbi:5289_t:CDS:10 [Acaulospora colombiana]|uniref:5289_t:CDS:1 n=1 Tax=Acaulospora colombiana TaxID=27376 RepID=A0ACA9KFC0_9GLOM|nr:5289_t:CDS:10 [Acaulospora colombiana]
MKSVVEEVSKEWALEPEHEFRFEVDFGTTVKLKLISGTAEIYGTEIGIGPEGICSVEYVANETPMTSYLNMHLALEQCREEAKSKDEMGPRVMIVGPEDVGKTSLSKILLSYAFRQGRQPIFVDLDTNEGSITMPGTLTTTVINQIIDVEEGFGSSTTTSPSLGSSMIPVAYYYGYSDPGENVKLYKVLTAKLAQTVKHRAANDEDAKVSGMVIDTSGDLTSNIFIVNIIIVLGHERLYSDMAKLYKEHPEISVLKLAKSGGARSLAPSSALPIGIDRKVSETQLVKVEPDDLIRHSILALTSSNSADEHELLETNIIGFIRVSEVDTVKQKMTILTPCPGRLPKQYLIMGSYKWMES